MLVHPPGTPLHEEIENKCLILSEDITLEMGGATLTVYGLPASRRDSNYLGNIELLREMDYDKWTIVNVVNIKYRNVYHDSSGYRFRTDPKSSLFHKSVS